MSRMLAIALTLAAVAGTARPVAHAQTRPAAAKVIQVYQSPS